VGSFAALFLARVGVGIGEAGSAPCMWSLVSDYFPPQRRASANGVLLAAMAIGALVAYVVGAPVAAASGWRAAFLGLGLPGLIFAPLCWFILREPRLKARQQMRGEPAEAFRATLKTLREKSSFVYITVAIIFYNIASSGTAAFSVSFANRVLVTDMTKFVPILGAVAVVAMTVGSVGGGAFLGLISKRNSAWLVRIPTIALFLTLPISEMGYLTTRPSFYLVSTFCVTLALAGTLPGIMSAIQLVVGSKRRAMAFAIVAFLTSLVGQGLGPPVVGVLSDLLSASLGPADGLRYALIVATLLYAPCCVFLWIAGANVERDAEA
jgi:MFS family permease